MGGCWPRKKSVYGEGSFLRHLCLGPGILEIKYALVISHAFVSFLGNGNPPGGGMGQ